MQDRLQATPQGTGTHQLCELAGLDVACNNNYFDVVQVHCVSAFGRLQEILQQHAPFPHGLILHSWIGPAEMVDTLAKLQGVYFSLSGHLTRMSKKKYEPMVKKVSRDRVHLFLHSQRVLTWASDVTCCQVALKALQIS